MAACSHWDVLEVLDLTRGGGFYISGLVEIQRAKAEKDIGEFFALEIRMLRDPLGTVTLYGGEVLGLDILDDFLRGRIARLGVRWKHSTFSVYKNEFGTVLIDNFRMRSI